MTLDEEHRVEIRGSEVWWVRFIPTCDRKTITVYTTMGKP